MSKQKKKGFTLIELLAVIVVLAIILVIAVPKILEVIENARLKAYENSVNLMINQAQLDYGSKGINEGNVSYPVSYIYGIDSNGETIQTNEKEVGLLNFKGDKPSEGTIIVDELGKVTVQNLVSKDRKFCAIKGPDQKNATVGKSNELNCIEEEEKEIVDKVPCELEIDKNDENVMYIDSVEDMYAFSDSVNNGNTYSGKTIKIRNDLDFKGYSEKKNVCGLASSFEPIGNKSHPFSGKIDGNIKYIKNLTIDKTGSDNVGIFGYTTSTASFVGLNLEKITVKGNNKVGSLVGYLSSKAQINEIVVKDVNVTGVKHIGGIVGYNYGQIKNAIVKSGKVEGTEGFVYGISGYYNGQNVTNSIVENVSTKNYRDAFSGPISYSSKDSYYSNKVTLNGVEKTDGLSESAISNINMYEYAGLDTYIGGDNTSTGYYFDYENDSSNNIVLKKAITNPDKVSLEGKGTKENPYLIKNMKDWKEVSRILNEEYYYKISNDIELSSGHFYMLGSSSNKFNGHVDGNLSRLYNLTLDIAPADNVGIFGYTTSTASFVGLNLENITVKGKTHVGSLVGYLSSKAQINEIVVKNVNVTGVKNIGGIVGYNYGQIKNAIVKSGKVEGTEDFVYGISGYYNGQNVTNSIVENVSTKNNRDAFSGPISYSSKDSYYSNKVTLNGVQKTDGLSESAISNINMYEYAGLDTYIGGDNTSTGYYFDYENNSSNNIVLKKAITNPDKVSLEGKGTKENPYLIKNMKDWKEVSRILNEEYYYKISNDIELSSGHFYMLGSSSNKFNGHVDGNLSRLYNLTLDIAPADNVGIFGYTTSTASFVGLNLENITVKGKTHVGSLVGYLSSKAQINEIVVKNVNVTGVKNIGGIVGYNYGQIKNAIVKSGKVEGTEDFVYGIAGWYNGQNVTNSIVENVSTKNNRDAFSGPISYSSKDSYYSNKVTLNGVEKTDGFDSNNIDNLSYYIGKVETINDGDKNNTGYYFDYVQSKNGIYLIKVK